MSVSRREFLRQSALTAGALALPTIIPSGALGKGGVVAPGEKITLGFIGTGGRGGGLLDTFLGQADTQVVAICDVDRNNLRGNVAKVNKKYGENGCSSYRDFRELAARTDLDGIVIATPDHWHALAAITALRAGKHVYCEKPLANSVPEGRAVADAVKAAKRAFQTGSHERSTATCRFACELVRNGRIGELKSIRINLPCDEAHHKQARAMTGIPPEKPVPEGFDYDMWLGHTALAPYSPERCHFWWRFNLAYGGGEMTDRGAHVMDIAQLGAGMDATSPVSIVAKGVRNAGSLYNTFWDYKYTLTYANGVRMEGSTDGPRGMKFEGTKGSIFVAIHGGALTAEPASLLQEKIGENEIQLGRSKGHQRDWLDAIRDGHVTMAPAEAAHRTATLCHLTNLAMAVERPLKYDPVTEQIVGDDDANKMLMPVMRAPWHL